MDWNPNWANAIASIESQGSGGYSAVGPRTAKGNRAYGKYQVMDFNIPTWTKKHLGRELSPQQFLNSPEAQEAVFRGEFGSSVSKYGNPQDAASVWFTGRPASQGAGRSDILGTTGAKYVNKFNAALGQGVTTSTKGSPMMQQEEKPRGFLGSLGIQKMEEGAAGETGQRFYQRDSFKDTAALLAQGFGRMGIMGMEEIADDIAKQRTENKARNKTMEAIGKMGTPQSQQALEYIKAGGDPVSALKIAFSKPTADPAEIRTLKYRAEAAGLKEGTPEYQKFMLTGGADSASTGPAAYEALRLRARDAGLVPGTPEFQQFMRTGGAGDTVASQEEAAEAKRLNQEQEDLAFFAAGERVLDRMKEPGLVKTTGVLADYVKDTPFGQRQLDVAEDLAMMEAQMQFQTLANLKASSPNGSSGLGQLTEAERKALGKLYANFSNRQSEDAVKRTIKSSMLLRAYFKNGLYDSTLPTPGQRNATPEELDQMLQGINPFEGSDGVQLTGVKSFNTAPPASGGAQKTKTGVTYKVID